MPIEKLIELWIVSPGKVFVPKDVTNINFEDYYGSLSNMALYPIVFVSLELCSFPL